MTRVAVLMGGFSSEREVSLSSGKGCVDGLRNAGFEVTAIDVTRDIGALLRALDPAPDAVFNALHGPFGEDGRIQGLLDILGIAYTHSGTTASAMAMDKSVSRAMFALKEIPLAEGWVVPRPELDAFPEPARPYVMKPLCEGSSVGVELVFDTDNKSWNDLKRAYAKYRDTLIERYIPGREIQVLVMGGRALGAIEIRTDRRFYDYRAKYSEGESVHLMPAPIHPEAYDLALDLAVRSHAALGCRGVSRVDLRYDDTKGEPGDLFVLEVNTQPGMTPTSLAPEIAAHAGWSFERLLTWLVEHAACDA
ncbi:MAG: D-alanine--D-alanine ligase [Rhodospirillaceae bacterium]|nr:D-alanine--D-alanine ligase [Rhodospirillaceae bacterium]